MLPYDRILFEPVYLLSSCDILNFTCDNILLYKLFCIIYTQTNHAKYFSIKDLFKSKRSCVFENYNNVKKTAKNESKYMSKYHLPPSLGLNFSIHRYRRGLETCPQAKILAFTFERFCLYRLKTWLMKISCI